MTHQTTTAKEASRMPGISEEPNHVTLQIPALITIEEVPDCGYKGVTHYCWSMFPKYSSDCFESRKAALEDAQETIQYWIRDAASG